MFGVRWSRSWFALVAALILTSCATHTPRGPVVIYLAGDSTMAEKLPEKRPETGWGEELQQYFRAGEARVDNRAKNGRSTRTFIEEGRWQSIVDALVPGDYVFIEFGHNDASVEKTDRYTPSDAYRANLERFVTDVRAKNARPILLTPVARRRFDAQGRVEESHPVYADLVREVARELKVPLIDMDHDSMQLLQRYGEEPSKKLFLILAPGESANYPQGLNDNTHFTPLGAEEMAKLAVAGIRKADSTLAARLK
jgi:lysophospholipase L1-like esterase